MLLVVNKDVLVVKLEDSVLSMEVAAVPSVVVLFVVRTFRDVSW